MTIRRFLAAAIAILADVSCTTEKDCAAVGRTGVAGVDPLVETWDGTTWTQAAAQRPPGSVGSVTLTGVSCAAGDCESVGVNRISAVNPELAAALRPVAIAGAA